MIQPNFNAQSAPTQVFVPVAQYAPILNPIPIPQNSFTQPGFIAATLTLASAASIGANMVGVQDGSMTKTDAVINGIAKGAAASVILAVTPKRTVLDIALAAAALAGSGYVIDRVMNNNRQADAKR